MNWLAMLLAGRSSFPSPVLLSFSHTQAKYCIANLISHCSNQTTLPSTMLLELEQFFFEFSFPKFCAHNLVSPRGLFVVFIRHLCLIFIIISYICYLTVYLFSDLLIWRAKEDYVSSICESKCAFISGENHEPTIQTWLNNSLAIFSSNYGH